MQLTIIGAGAIGGTIGAHLIRDGHDVLLCDTDTGHVGAINRHGLSIEGPVENFTVAARAVTPDGLPGSLGRVAIAVKSHHTAQAAEPLRGRLDPQGYVVSFQNGLTVDLITAVTGPGRLVTSFVNFGADLLAPASCRAMSPRPFVIMGLVSSQRHQSHDHEHTLWLAGRVGRAGLAGALAGLARVRHDRRRWRGSGR